MARPLYFLQGAIAFNISARKEIGSGVIPIAKSFLTPPTRPEVSIVAGHLEAPQKVTESMADNMVVEGVEEGVVQKVDFKTALAQTLNVMGIRRLKPK